MRLTCLARKQLKPPESLQVEFLNYLSVQWPQAFNGKPVFALVGLVGLDSRRIRATYWRVSSDLSASCVNVSLPVHGDQLISVWRSFGPIVEAINDFTWQT